ncbi:MAG: phosphoglycerate kinase [Chloroflexota bacterium]|nr:phosphoglycerate kinase [Chloroflexota bacterium]
MNKKTVRDVDVRDKRVLVRVDFNVPLAGGEVADDTRIRAALPTIRYLVDHGARVILMSHLGRPKGQVKEELRMVPVAVRLGELLGQPVLTADDCVGPQVQALVKELKSGQVLVLENTRFHSEERKNDSEFARELASLGDVFVNDAFGAAHRAHASTEGVTHYLPAVAGFLMEKEIEFLSKALESPAHPFVAILGGAKISDKIGVIDNLLGKVETLLIGGGMANTFLKAQGYDVAESLVEDESLNTAREMLAKSGGKLVVPVDVVVADSFAADARSKTVGVDAVPAGWRILDVGPQTVNLFKNQLAGAKTVVWNGPMGVFEFPKFAMGTVEVAKVLATLDAMTIIGGGDSVAAVYQAGLADKMTHISTGGGASLEFLEGKTLPCIAALANR